MIQQLSGKIVFLSDIHGNFIALNDLISFLKDFKPDFWCILGDTIGYFPDGNKVLKLIKKLNPICIKGNHEAMIVSRDFSNKDDYYRLKKQLDALETIYLDWINTWPEKLVLKLGNCKSLIVHGSPSSPLNGYIYPDTNLEQFNLGDASMVFFGHTHRPFLRNSNDKIFCNVGSVGFPRDNSKKSTAVIFDSNTNSCSFIKIDINYEEIMRQYHKFIHKDVIDKI
jgi:putative phosphoesterase